jgi:hypothetical protein
MQEENKLSCEGQTEREQILWSGVQEKSKKQMNEKKLTIKQTMDEKQNIYTIL